MRGKRSKAYRKLMTQYQMAFGFREPYQVLVDAEIVKDASKFKMDLPGGLKRTFHGEVKPMITQCSIRHLYSLPAYENPQKDSLIDLAKTFERRRCNHQELEEPLSEKECLESVVITKGENKHRYCVATQDPEIRAMLRAVPGVPLVYINRSVMIMEPMAPISTMKREREERGKFRLGIKDNRRAGRGGKRKRGEEGDGSGKEGEEGNEGGEKKKKKKRKGPKEPNPLAVKKKKPKPQPRGEQREKVEDAEPTVQGESESGGAEGSAKKKRKRRHGKGSGGDREESSAVPSHGEA